MSILEMAIGWLAPPICVICGAEGSALCQACKFSEIMPFGEHCWHCAMVSPRSKTCPAGRRTGSPAHVWVSASYGGAVQKLIQVYKFGHQRAASQVIAGLMAETFLAQNSDAAIAKKDYLLIPIPTASVRIRERSFDHTGLLAERLSQSLPIEKLSVLGRIGTSAQVGAGRVSRLSQAKGAYFVKKPALVAGRNILLVDDVVTTGATLTETARILRAAGAKSVDALVLAKSL